MDGGRPGGGVRLRVNWIEEGQSLAARPGARWDFTSEGSRKAYCIRIASESNTEYITGTITSVRNVAKVRPDIIAVPIGPQN